MKAAGWQQISEVDVEPGDIVIYDVFDGNEHTGFFIGNEMVVSTGREDTSDMEGSPRSPQPHHMFYQGRPDGPRTIQSYWTHPKFHQQYSYQKGPERNSFRAFDLKDALRKKVYGNYCEEYSKNSTSNHLAGPVTHSFFKARKFFFIEIKLFDKHISIWILTLDACGYVQHHQ